MHTSALRIALIALALVVPVDARGTPDQLTKGEFDEGRPYYRELIQTALSEGYESGVRTRALISSELGEHLIAVRSSGLGFELFVLRPKIALSEYEFLRDLRDGRFDSRLALTPEELALLQKELEATLPRNVRDVPVERCLAQLSERTAASIIAAWMRVLSRAQQDTPVDERLVLDGANFHFWVKEKQEFAGHVYAPNGEWPSGQLSSVSAEMYKFCKSPTRAGELALERRANDVR